MYGNKSGIKQLFKSVNIQPNKSSDVREDGMEKAKQKRLIPIDHIIQKKISFSP